MVLILIINGIAIIGSVLYAIHLIKTAKTRINKLDLENRLSSNKNNKDREV